MVSLSSREEMVWEGSSNSTVCPHHRAGSQSDANVPSLTFSTSACLPYWSSENKTHVKLNLILQGGLSADLDLGTEILEPLFLMSYSTDKDAIQLIKSQREKPQQVSVTRSKANPQHGSADYNVLNRKILIEKKKTEELLLNKQKPRVGFLFVGNLSYSAFLQEGHFLPGHLITLDQLKDTYPTYVIKSTWFLIILFSLTHKRSPRQFESQQIFLLMCGIVRLFQCEGLQ